jgi:hypothetical protein
MEPASISFLLKVASDAKRALDMAALKARIDRVDQGVDAIGRHLEENVLAELRSAFSHLEVAVAVSDTTLSHDELSHARQAFNRLAERRPRADDLVRTHGSLTAAHVSALGHFGNYHYFLLRDQPDQALIAAYRCTEQFPALGVSLFPVKLFSRNYRDVVSMTPEEIHASYARAQACHVEERRRYGRDMAWRLPAAAGAFVAGLAGSWFNPSLAAKGLQGATGLLMSNKDGLLPPSGPSRAHYLALAANAEKKLAPVAAEAHERLLMIQAQVQGRSSQPQ